MCGRFNVTDDPYMHALLDGLGVDLGPLPVRVSNDVAPTDPVSILVADDHESMIKGVMIKEAIWWLLLQHEAGGFRPLTKYASFNTRSDKLNVKGSAGFEAFRHTRCIIPASGFVETQNGHAYTLTPEDNAIAFGGLYRRWWNRETGEQALSCSIITLPPHPKIAPYHAKSMPLMLPPDPTLQRHWLTCSENELDSLEAFLTPTLPYAIRVTPIEKASRRTATGESVRLEAD